MYPLTTRINVNPVERAVEQFANGPTNLHPKYFSGRVARLKRSPERKGGKKIVFRTAEIEREREKGPGWCSRELYIHEINYEIEPVRKSGGDKRKDKVGHHHVTRFIYSGAGLLMATARRLCFSREIGQASNTLRENVRRLTRRTDQSAKWHMKWSQKARLAASFLLSSEPLKFCRRSLWRFSGISFLRNCVLRSWEFPGFRAFAFPFFLLLEDPSYYICDIRISSCTFSKLSSLGLSRFFKIDTLRSGNFSVNCVDPTVRE